MQPWHLLVVILSGWINRVLSKNRIGGQYISTNGSGKRISVDPRWNAASANSGRGSPVNVYGPLRERRQPRDFRAASADHALAFKDEDLRESPPSKRQPFFEASRAKTRLYQ